MVTVPDRASHSGSSVPAAPLAGGQARRRRWLRWYAVLRRAAAILGLAFVIVSVTPIDFWWAEALGRWTGADGDVLVVLAGSSFQDGQMGPSSYLRAMFAAWSYRNGHFHTMVVSGGGNPPAAEEMRDYLVTQGVPASQILLETKSLSTRENALDCRPILEKLPGSKVLLTSDYHSYRAIRVFRKVGIAVTPRPAPHITKLSSQWTQRWPCFLELVGESAKIVYYRLRGWM